MSALQKQLIMGKLPPRNSNPRVGARRGPGSRRDYTPLSWDKYFNSSKDIEIDGSSIFRVYTAGNSGPVLFLLHGGGYCGLTWSLFTSSITQMVECQVAAMDIRGHGETQTANDKDLSAETLSRDISQVMQRMYHGKEVPPVILIGHSMGGAIAVHAVYRELIPTCIGLVVIDVVEGTAMEALQSMQSFLRGRPSVFTTLENAIEWCVRSGQVKNVESARVSMPGQLKRCASSLPTTSQIGGQSIRRTDTQKNPENLNFRSDAIPEEEEEEARQNNKIASSQNSPAKSYKMPEKNSNIKEASDVFKIPNPPNENTQYTWRIDLSETEVYWTGWFKGLSDMFLSTNVPKLLLLAGVDRLDRVLTIGQMQGKFQMQVLPQCGHAVHEDEPEKVAEAIATFIVRHKFASPTSDFHRTFPAC